MTMGPHDDHRLVLYAIACGGRPAADLTAVIQHPHAAGWQVCVVATPSAMQSSTPQPRQADRSRVRSDYKRPEEPDLLPWPPDALVVAPAIFNTVNKWAARISDTPRSTRCRRRISARRAVPCSPGRRCAASWTN
jgi:hypothetical protein